MRVSGDLQMSSSGGDVDVKAFLGWVQKRKEGVELKTVDCRRLSGVSQLKGINR